LPYWLAGALAFAAGAVDGYVLNRRWTFAAADSAASRLRYLTVQLAGLGATTALLWFYVSIAGVHRLWAYALTIPASPSAPSPQTAAGPSNPCNTMLLALQAAWLRAVWGL
jgi:putative flippase GtrA